MTRLLETSTLSAMRFALLAAGVLTGAGCQQQMADQPSYKPLQPCTFFDDQRSARPLVPGTVARGQLRVDTVLFTGRLPFSPSLTSANKGPAADLSSVNVRTQGETAPISPGPGAVPTGFDDDAAFTREFPIPINRSVIQHGFHRYMIYCVMCHDALGTGRGKIVERGYTAPPSYHIPRLRAAPIGRLFAVATEGYGSMPSYAEQIPPEDRWAIIAYIRALQLSQHFPEDKLSPEMLRALEDSASQSGAGAGATLEPRGEVR